MIKNYLFIARIDHWFKNIFMLPGLALAIIFTHPDIVQAITHSLIAIFSTCFIVSANYVINEWLDAEFDQHHPVKKYRPAVAGNMKAEYVYLEYALFSILGLGLALQLSPAFLIFSASLLFMGIVYNVSPFRTKDRAYLDVLSESFNNPLRFLLGWTAITSQVFPPSSILLAYWMGGGFLMAVKRYAEYRFINDPKKAGSYRRSFKVYTEKTLLLSSFFYAITSCFFLGIFLIKYRIEFLLSFPLFALLFVWYLGIGMKPLSPTQSPEKFYQEKNFMIYLIFLCLVVSLLFLIDIPFLHKLVEPLTY
jgi:4-hydroxybenzoate polyprenyltransferase